MDFEPRIKRLERENRILKYGGLLVVAVVLISAFVPQDQVPDIEPPISLDSDLGLM